MTTHLILCGAGAGLAMVGHFPARPSLWAPHVLGLAAMLLAWLPAAQPVGTPAALLVLAAVVLWQVCCERAGSARWSGAVDTAAMAALIALAGAGAVTHGPAGMHGTHHSEAAGMLPYALAVFVAWLAVRTVTWKGGRSGRSADRDEAAPAQQRSRRDRALTALPFTGALVMLTTMTAMLA